MNRRLIISLICWLSCVSLAWPQGSPNSKVIVYYFHGDFRCVNCYNIEKYTKEALEANFKKELGSGELTFQPVNFDKKENQHFIEDYQLYTKSLVLSLVKDGKQIRWKNLDKIWEYVRNKQKFIDYVKAGVADFLREAE